MDLLSNIHGPKPQYVCMLHCACNTNRIPCSMLMLILMMPLQVDVYTARFYRSLLCVLFYAFATTVGREKTLVRLVCFFFKFTILLWIVISLHICSILILSFGLFGSQAHLDSSRCFARTIYNYLSVASSIVDDLNFSWIWMQFILISVIYVLSKLNKWPPEYVHPFIST